MHTYTAMYRVNINIMHGNPYQNEEGVYDIRIHIKSDIFEYIFEYIY